MRYRIAIIILWSLCLMTSLVPALPAQHILWEQSLPEESRIPMSSGAVVQGQELAVDEKGRIHIAGHSAPGTIRVGYALLTPDGTVIRRLLYDSGDWLAPTTYHYMNPLLRVGPGVSPALIMHRGDPGLDHVLIHLDETGAPIDTLIDSTFVSPVGVARLLDSDGGNIYASLSKYQFGLPDNHVVAVKYDSNGRALWRKSYAASLDSAQATVDIRGRAMAKAPENGYFLLCSYEGKGSFSARDALLLRLDSTGEEVWRLRVTDTIATGYFTFGNDVCPTRDGGALFVCPVQGSVGGFRQDFTDIYRVDSAGQLLWRRSLVHLLPRMIEIYACDSTSDGGFLFAGRTKQVNASNQFIDTLTQFYLLKTDGEGNTDWEWEYGSDTTADWIQNFTWAADTLIVCGTSGTTGPDGVGEFHPRNDFRMYVAKLIPPRTGGVSSHRTHHVPLTLSPNPSQDHLTVSATLPSTGTIRIEVVDSRGEIILSEQKICLQSLAFSNTFIMSGLVAGHYFVRIILNNEVIAAGAFSKS